VRARQGPVRVAHDVFLSYSSRDAAVANAVCSALERRGVRCWVAPRDVLPGQTWAGAIIDAIEHSRLAVLILSGNSSRSGQVLREVANAVAGGIPVVPFRVEDVQPSKEMQYYISTVHWLDAVTPPLADRLRDLADTVEALLTGDGKQGLPVVASEAVRADPVGRPSTSFARPEVSRGHRRAMPIWSRAALGVATVAFLGAAGLWVTTHRSTQSAAPPPVTATSVASPHATDLAAISSSATRPPTGTTIAEARATDVEGGVTPAAATSTSTAVSASPSPVHTATPTASPSPANAATSTPTAAASSTPEATATPTPVPTLTATPAPTPSKPAPDLEPAPLLGTPLDGAETLPGESITWRWFRELTDEEYYVLSISFLTTDPESGATVVWRDPESGSRWLQTPEFVVPGYYGPSHASADGWYTWTVAVMRGTETAPQAVSQQSEPRRFHCAGKPSLMSGPAPTPTPAQQ
jgi:hypothetical protein